MLANSFKIVGINLDIAWKNKAQNFKQIEELLADVQADLFLLPEMFSTGFCMEAEEIADSQESTLSWMKKVAQEKQTAIAGSVSVKVGNHFYNRFYFVEPNGKYTFYDKRHLFSFSGEDKIYTPGDEKIVVTYKGVRFLLQVCYDLRFPVFSRYEEDYDAILYVANWPQKRVEAWRHLLKARAIENMSYVFGLNRVGEDGNKLFYEESSLFFGADGKDLSQHQGPYVIGEIDLNDLKKIRNHFGFLNDRDNFKII